MAERDRALLDYVRDCALAHPIETMALKIRNRAYALQPRLLPFTERVGEASIVFYPTSRLLAPATLVLMYYTAAWSERRRWRTLAR